MKARVFNNILFALIIGVSVPCMAQEKPEPDNSFYLGVSPLDMLQGNIRIEPGFNHLNLRLTFPINIYQFSEVSSRFTNKYSHRRNVGSSLHATEKGDLLKGVGFNFRPIFLLKKSYGPIEETKFTFMSFSIGYHVFRSETRGLSYIKNKTPDGKEFYDFGRSQYNYQTRMIPFRFQVGNERSFFKIYRISYWVGIGYNFFQNKDEFIAKYSKSNNLTSVYYSKSPFPIFNLQIGKNFLRKN